MRVGSLFSGIGGLDLGLERAGMEVIWQVEIDPFRRRVLARHWPGVERFEDVLHVRGESAGGTPHHDAVATSPARGQKQALLSSVSLICGGFPCQDLSVAGRRAGLRAARSGLFFEFARIVGEVLPAWVLVENVPGLLSSNGGDDFRVVVDALQGLGYGLSWRIFDSRYFGVPQRRRRVYVVGSLGGLRSAAVLFEPEGGAGDTPQGREAGEGAARTVAPGPHGYRFDYLEAESYVCAPADPDGVREATGVPRRVDVRPRGETVLELAHHGANQAGYREGSTYPVSATQAVLAAPLEAADGHHGRSSPRGDGADNLIASPLRSRQSAEGVNPPGRGGEDDANIVIEDVKRQSVGWGKRWRRGETNALQGGGHIPGVLAQPADPDGAGGPQGDAARPCCPDGPRYAALGDAVTVNVAEWIGRRIMMAGAAP